MATAEFLAEEDVTPTNLAQIFKRAFFKTSFDNDGDLVVHTEGPRVVLTADQDKKLLKFIAVYGLKESAKLPVKHAFVNKMNDEIIFARFSVPERRSDILMTDYFLPFEEGIPAYQVVAAMRLFARVVPGAIRACDTNELME